jgi:hypothetical protein
MRLVPPVERGLLENLLEESLIVGQAPDLGLRGFLLLQMSQKTLKIYVVILHLERVSHQFESG